MPLAAACRLGGWYLRAQSFDQRSTTFFWVKNSTCIKQRLGILSAFEVIIDSKELRTGNDVQISRVFGSRVSRIPSPNKLIESMVMNIANPGKIDIHQAARK